MERKDEIIEAAKCMPSPRFNEDFLGTVENPEALEVMLKLAFAEGAKWADENPSTETLLKAFWDFDKHGLIKEDLCFDPRHFIETVIRG